MRKICKILSLILLFILIMWLSTVTYANILTAMHGDEFTVPESVGFTGMHPWNGKPNLRVMFYSNSKAKVYYYGEMGGELAVFIKDNGSWNYKKSTHIWSDYGGTADDYFIWPYFKNFVI